jgi:beta-phosphoglucomutase-like phosphatase (HAD superfamily)
MEAAVPVPHAVETVAAMKALGYATAIWTNNDRVVADFVLARFALLPHLDLVVTRDDVTSLKPDPDGLRVVRARWPDTPRIVVVGDSWVDGAAAQAGGVSSTCPPRSPEDPSPGPPCSRPQTIRLKEVGLFGSPKLVMPSPRSRPPDSATAARSTGCA